MLKKSLSAILSLVMLLNLYACGGGGSTAKLDIKGITPLVEYATNQSLESMGSIPFGVDEDSEPLEWVVIKTEGDKALLLSKYILNADGYEESQPSVTWETSAMRKYLNSEFINKVFSKKDQNAIVNSDVINNNNAEYGTNCGNNTKDKVFLLSVDEINEYLKDRAVAKYKNGDSGWYPLRTLGCDNSHVTWIEPSGSLNMYGGELSGGLIWGGGIRPALWVYYQ